MLQWMNIAQPVCVQDITFWVRSILTFSDIPTNPCTDKTVQTPPPSQLYDCMCSCIKLPLLVFHQFIWGHVCNSLVLSQTNLYQIKFTLTDVLMHIDQKTWQLRQTVCASVLGGGSKMLNHNAGRVELRAEQNSRLVEWEMLSPADSNSTMSYRTLGRPLTVHVLSSVPQNGNVWMLHPSCIDEWLHPTW